MDVNAVKTRLLTRKKWLCELGVKSIDIIGLYFADSKEMHILLDLSVRDEPDYFNVDEMENKFTQILGIKVDVFVRKHLTAIDYQEAMKELEYIHCWNKYFPKNGILKNFNIPNFNGFSFPH